MARIRSIKPEFPQSETMGRLSREARLLFVLLWTIVDDAGRARAASRMLASLLYPYDDDAPKQIERWLQELEINGCIRRYEVEGSQYLDIPNWLKHQKIDRPTPSRLPVHRESSSEPRENSRGLDADLGSRILDQEEDLGSKSAREARENNEKSKPRNKGTRLPEDWHPTDEGMIFALEVLGAGRVHGELAKFRDYWLAKAGQGAVKADWGRTWNNWCRTAAERQGHNSFHYTLRSGSREAQRQEERDALDQLTKFYQSNPDDAGGSRRDDRPDAPVLPFHRRA